MEYNNADKLSNNKANKTQKWCIVMVVVMVVVTVIVMVYSDGDVCPSVCRPLPMPLSVRGSPAAQLDSPQVARLHCSSAASTLWYHQVLCLDCYIDTELHVGLIVALCMKLPLYSLLRYDIPIFLYSRSECSGEIPSIASPTAGLEAEVSSYIYMAWTVRNFKHCLLLSSLVSFFCVCVCVCVFQTAGGTSSTGTE